jgi:hypothetical protein
MFAACDKYLTVAQHAQGTSDSTLGARASPEYREFRQEVKKYLTDGPNKFLTRDLRPSRPSD